MAGLFAAYSYAVMPGLGRTGDATFVEAMQQSNAAILNGWFGVCFGGAPCSPRLRRSCTSAEPGLPWIVAGLVLYAAVLVITFRGQRAAERPARRGRNADDAADAAAARAAFEGTWVRWNVVRAVCSTEECGAWSARWSSAEAHDPGRGLGHVKGALRTRCGSGSAKGAASWRHGDRGERRTSSRCSAHRTGAGDRRPPRKTA